jgi:hypothetical protein
MNRQKVPEIDAKWPLSGNEVKDQRPPIFSGGWERNRFSLAAENRSGVGFDPVRPRLPTASHRQRTDRG